MISSVVVLELVTPLGVAAGLLACVALVVWLGLFVSGAVD